MHTEQKLREAVASGRIYQVRSFGEKSFQLLGEAVSPGNEWLLRSLLEPPKFYIYLRDHHRRCDPRLPRVSETQYEEMLETWMSRMGQAGLSPQ